MRGELLANYLEPRFGNIYDDLLTWRDDPWSTELKDAVRHFLLQVLDEHILAELLDRPGDQPPDEPSRQREVDDFIAGQQPWEVALAVRNAAVVVVPTLDELIGQLETWPDGDIEFDVETWLDAHASQDQVRQMARFSNHPDLRRRDGTWSPLPDDLIRVLGPRELLAAWHRVTGPALSPDAPICYA